MKKLSKEKKQQLILLGIGTVFLLAWLWFGLIGYQQRKINEIASRVATTQAAITKNKRAIEDAHLTDAALEAAGRKLAAIETTMASGDLFSWLVSSIKQFNNSRTYKVEMPQFGIPTVGDMTLIPGFPFKQATIVVGGTAYYYDFGKFLADFENHFPYARVENLTLEPVTSANPEDREKLSFHMEVVTLVKAGYP